MTELSGDVPESSPEAFNGVCIQIKNEALNIVRGLGATVGFLEEAMEEACGGDCLVCPVELRRRGQNVAMNIAQTTIFGITSGWSNLVDAVVTIAPRAE